MSRADSGCWRPPTRSCGWSASAPASPTSLDVVELERRIRDRVRDNMDKSQREYYLRQQLEVIHDELGGGEGNEFEQLREAINSAMPEAVRDKLLRELTCLERMPGVSAEATVARTLHRHHARAALVGGNGRPNRLDEADRVLNKDHYGLRRSWSFSSLSPCAC